MAVQNELTTYIALFHHRDHAASAIRDLEKSGFTREALTVIGGGNGTGYSDANGAFGDGYGYGVQSGLAEIGVPEADRKHLQDGLAQGGTILVLKGAGERAAEIEKIFHEHATKKIDETTAERAPYVAPIAAAAAATTATADPSMISVVQEDLVVGKREVDRGGVRIFRRVVEEPVSESINLREEHVVIDRRPVDRAVTEADLLAGDQTIELKEMAEVAVVEKTSRVVEEVRLGKEATNRTETIQDTVRHTEIDVEQVAANATNVANPTKTY